MIQFCQSGFILDQGHLDEYIKALMFGSYTLLHDMLAVKNIYLYIYIYIFKVNILKYVADF